MTSLLIDMVEQGWLKQAPMPRRPIPALHTLARDSELRQKIAVRGGRKYSAIELQRYYLEQAKLFLQKQAAISVEYRDVVRLWEQMLQHVETDPGKAFGCLDWVTKRTLMNSPDTTGLNADARKKIDLKYHQIGNGYYDELKASGLVEILVEDKDVETAIFDPPQTRAALRSRLIKQILDSDKELIVSWEQVRVKSADSKKDNIIKLDDYRPS
jgi:proteasome accessory factor A